MHPFMLVAGLLHATAIAVIAFFVLFTAGKASGWLRLAGKILGGWLVILTLLCVVFALFAPAIMAHHHMMGWGARGAMPAAAAPVAPANTTP